MPAIQKLTTKQWESIKLIFLQLYQIEKKTLAQVRYELEQRHNFKASKSSFTRQIRKWNATKNYNASDKDQLRQQRMRGLRPVLDKQGRPVSWHRVFRETRGSANRKPIQQPINHDIRVLDCVFDIWRHSTLRYASEGPWTTSYKTEYKLYIQMTRLMNISTLPSRSQWPQMEVSLLCDTMPKLIKAQPPLACDLLTFLTWKSQTGSFGGHEALKDELFKFIRAMTSVILPKTHPFQRLVSELHDRDTLNRLAVAIAKVKLNTMWNSCINEGHEAQYKRPFFCKVLMKALFVVIDFEELIDARLFLDKLSKYYADEPFFEIAYAKLLDRQGNHEQAMHRRPKAYAINNRQDQLQLMSIIEPSELISSCGPFSIL